MDRTATQHAGIAGESINGVNWAILAARTDKPDADIKKAKDAYEVAASVKLTSQRMMLTARELKVLMAKWHEEGHLVTSPETSLDDTITAFAKAMDDAEKAAKALWFALSRGTDAMALIGWQTDTTAGHSDTAK
jgi:hypothetical protein